MGKELSYNRVPPGTRRSTYEDTPYGELPGRRWSSLPSRRRTRRIRPETRCHTPASSSSRSRSGRRSATPWAGLTSVLTGDMTPEEMQQRAQAEALQVAKQGKYLKN